MGLFSKKEGGTFFGNLIRVAANKASGGLLGTGAGIIPVGTAAAAADAAELARLRAGAAAAGAAIVASTAYGAGTATQAMVNSQSPQGVALNMQNGAIMGFLQTYWLPVLAAVGLIVYLVTKKK